MVPSKASEGLSWLGGGVDESPQTVFPFQREQVGSLETEKGPRLGGEGPWEWQKGVVFLRCPTLPFSFPSGSPHP